MDLSDIPARSIEAFEKIHRLRVTVHDLTGGLWPFLSPEQFRHTAPLCAAVKNGPAGHRCVEFEIDELRRDLPALPAGRVHVCHAGFVEWVVPVFGRSAMEMILFAGTRSPGRSLRCDVRAALSSFSTFPTLTRSTPPQSRTSPPSLTSPARSRASSSSLPVLTHGGGPVVEEDESQLILEHLRQLAARLKQWTIDYRAIVPPRDSPGGVPVAQRLTAVRRFVVDRHTQPVRLKDLADTLGLTESRTSHVVQQLCSRSFRQMLVEARLRTAMGLLRHSGLPVLDVAARSGFDDLRHFHRLFKRSTGETPHRYRARKE